MGTFMFDRLDSLLKSSGITRKALCQASGHADNYIRMFEKRNTEPPRRNKQAHEGPPPGSHNRRPPSQERGARRQMP